MEEDKKNYDNKKNIKLNYVVKNISLSNYLTNCLPDYKTDAGYEIKMDQVGNSNVSENNNNENINYLLRQK